MQLFFRLSTLLFVSTCLACGATSTDGGSSTEADAGASRELDAGQREIDGGVLDDAGPNPDAGSVSVDAGLASDAGILADASVASVELTLDLSEAFDGTDESNQLMLLEEPNAVEVSSAVIGSEGGSIELENIHVTVPPGTFDSEMEIVVAETDLDPPDGIELVSPIFSCQPSGVVFDPPLEVTLRLNDEPSQMPHVIWTGAEGADAELLDATINGNTLTVQSSHCSLLAAIVAGHKLYKHFTDTCGPGGCCPNGTYGCANNVGCCPTGTDCYQEQCVTCPEGTTINDDGNCYRHQCPAGHSACGSVCCNDSVATCQNNSCAYTTCPHPLASCSDNVSCCETAQHCAPDGGCYINPCTFDNGGCDPLTVCGWVAGNAPSCSLCPSGYRGDGETGCVDVDECAENPFVCGVRSCTNTTGSYTCGTCPDGLFTGFNGSCYTTEHCSVDNGGCDPLTDCSIAGENNSSCGACPAGYIGNGLTECVDINECLVDNGGCGTGTCTNTPGGRSCSCPVGFDRTDETTRVFVTSETFTPDLGGALGADVKCQAAADAQSLGGTWSAWISHFGVRTPGTDFPKRLSEYALLDGTVIAENWPELVSGTLQNGINIQEDGATATGNLKVWTGVTQEGFNIPVTSASHLCYSWTVTSPLERLIGGVGLAGTTDEDWTNQGTAFCSERARLYCFADMPTSTCDDADECSNNNGGCDFRTTCTNTPGSWTCGPCPEGYTGDGFTGCNGNTYSLGGTMSGLSAPVTLQNNGIIQSITENGPFTFASSVTYGTSYNVIVFPPPAGQDCTVTNGSGPVPLGDITDVEVNCVNRSFTLGGTATGLTGPVTLVNGSDTVLVFADGGFTFPEAVEFTSAYDVTVQTSPAGQVCSVTDGAGNMPAGDVTNIVVTCEAAPVNRVFVTSTSRTTDFGGVAVADGACQAAADAQSLTGRWRAWLADGLGNSPLVNLHQSSFRYVQLDGSVIAEDWNDLVDGDIQNGITIQEDGTATPAGEIVFTGAASDGTALTGGGVCGNWTVAPGDGSTFMSNGITGDTTAYWSFRGTAFCNVQGRFYCFEQPTTRIFVTSTTYPADFGGVPAADAICQAAADTQSVGGIWRAWLADTTGNSPAVNLTQQSHAYVQLDGSVVADDWSDLTDGTIDTGIVIQEDGTPAPAGQLVFTGTATDGTAQVGGGLCGDWTIAPGDGSTFMTNGITGDATGYWNNRGTAFCNVQGRLYCIEDN